MKNFERYIPLKILSLALKTYLGYMSTHINIICTISYDDQRIVIHSSERTHVHTIGDKLIACAYVF